MMTLAQAVLAAWTVLMVPPSVRVIQQDLVIAEFDSGATDVCVFARREVREEPSSNWPDGWYTPSDCSPLWAEDEVYESDLLQIVPEWYARHGEPKAEWTLWAEVVYVGRDPKDGHPIEMKRKSNEVKVTR